MISTSELATASEPQASRPRGGDTVLLVEDSRSIASLIKTSIAPVSGVRCTHTTDLASTRLFLQERADDCFVAVLDLNLPDAPNGEIVDLVLQYQIPVVILTSSMDEDRRQALFKKNIADYVRKNNLSSVEYVVRLIERMRDNRSHRVLVVDDSASYRAYLCTLLHNHGYRTLQAGDGREGLQVLSENADIRLVLTDYNMPNMDGMRMVEEMRRIRSAQDLAIIGMSTVSERRIVPRFLKSGGNDFLTKPFELEELYCRIDQNLDMLRYVQEARDAANRDFLTRLYNRRYFFEHASGFHARALRGEIKLLVTMMDADHFKRINDTFGHQMGDDALVAIAEALRQEVQGTGVLARFGGEEFVCIRVVEQDQDIEPCLERMRLAIENIALFTDEGEQVPLTMSIGATTRVQDNLDAMLAIADDAVYQAKQAGRNRYVFV